MIGPIFCDRLWAILLSRAPSPTTCARRSLVSAPGLTSRRPDFTSSTMTTTSRRSFEVSFSRIRNLICFRFATSSTRRCPGGFTTCCTFFRRSVTITAGGYNQCAYNTNLSWLIFSRRSHLRINSCRSVERARPWSCRWRVVFLYSSTR